MADDAGDAPAPAAPAPAEPPAPAESAAARGDGGEDAHEAAEAAAAAAAAAAADPAPAAAAEPAPPPLEPLAPGWTQLDAQGTPFYFHKASGAVKWTRPTVSAAEAAAASMRDVRAASAVKESAGGDSAGAAAAAAEGNGAAAAAGDNEIPDAATADNAHDNAGEDSLAGANGTTKKRKAVEAADAEEEDEDDVDVAIEEMSQERKDLQARLSSKDAILDPRVKSWMAQWLRRQGEDDSAKRRPKRARRDVDLLVEMLSSGYDGFAEYTGLVARWLRVLEDPAQAADQQAQQGQQQQQQQQQQHPLSSSLAQQQSPAQQQQSQTQGSALSRSLSLRPGEADPEQEPPIAAVEYLSKLVDQHFDREKFAAFMDMEEPPLWLKGMLRSSQWRAALIRLADKHKAVPLLDFAVRAMCKEGHHAEVAKAMSPASYFAVFRRTFTDLLREILDCDESRGSSPTELSKMEERFRELAGHSQYTYFFAMEALEALEGSDDLPEGLKDTAAAKATETANALRVTSTLLRSKLRRLRQGLVNVPRKQGSAEKGRNSVVELCKPLNRRNAYGLSASPACGGFPTLAQLLRTGLDNRVFDRETFAQLRAIYDPERNPEASLVPLWPLRRLEVILLLVTQLFDPFRQMDPESIKDGAYVTAVAAARVPGKGLEREVYVALVDAVKICKDKNTMSMEALQVSSPSMQMLSGLVADYPIVSSGVIRFARSCILSPSFQREKYFYSGMRVMLHLIRCAARAHPLQRIMAFFVLCQTLSINPVHVYQTKLLEIKMLVVDEFIFLVETGFIFQVLDFVRTEAAHGRMDAPLVRHFVVALAKTVGSNLSPEFARSVLQLVTLDACSRAVRAAHNRDHIRLVSDLRARCQNTVALASTMPSSAVSSSVMQFASKSSTPKPGSSTASAGGSAGAAAGGSAGASAGASASLGRTSSVISAASAAASAATRGGTGQRREKISLVPFRPK